MSQMDLKVHIIFGHARKSSRLENHTAFPKLLTVVADHAHMREVLTEAVEGFARKSKAWRFDNMLTWSSNPPMVA